MTIRFISAEKFAHVLGEHLVEFFGRRPSASLFADHFNLRAYGAKTITRETARKWIRGEALPNWANLTVLINWLGINPSSLYENEDQTNQTNSANGETVDSTENFPSPEGIKLPGDISPLTTKLLTLLAISVKSSKSAADVELFRHLLNELANNDRQTSV